MACIFCQIIDRSIPADIVHEDDDLIVFKDINPKGAIHVLLVPKVHVATVNDLEDHQIPVMGHMFEVVKQLAAKWDIVEQGYRLTLNVGRGGGQEVDHIHMHMVSGGQWRA